MRSGSWIIRVSCVPGVSADAAAGEANFLFWLGDTRPWLPPLYVLCTGRGSQVKTYASNVYIKHLRAHYLCYLLTTTRWKDRRVDLGNHSWWSRSISTLFFIMVPRIEAYTFIYSPCPTIAIKQSNKCSLVCFFKLNNWDNNLNCFSFSMILVM